MSLVLFDIDGTLVRNAGPHHKRALENGLCRVTGLVRTLDGISTHGMLDCDLIRTMLGEGEWDSAMAEIVEACQREYLENCPEDLTNRVCPGVYEGLQRLKDAGACLGLVTGNLSVIGWKKMELAGLRGFFSIGAFAEQASTRAGLAAIAAQEALNQGLLCEPVNISLVGDHPNDVMAAKANGFRAIAVATGMSTREELASAQPDVLLGTLHELSVDQILP